MPGAPWPYGTQGQAELPVQTRAKVLERWRCPQAGQGWDKAGARLGETREGNTWQPWPWHNNLDSPLFFSSFSVAVLSRLMHLFLLSVFLSPPRAVMVTQWIRTNAAHYVTCPLPQQWWQNRITKGKSMPKG